jgi:hypothetical protein
MAAASGSAALEKAWKALRKSLANSAFLTMTLQSSRQSKFEVLA